MWLILIGCVVAAAGWVLLIFGVSESDTGLLIPRLNLNPRALALASNIIYFGYFLVIVGAIRQLAPRKDMVPRQVTPQEDEVPRIAAVQGQNAGVAQNSSRAAPVKQIHMDEPARLHYQNEFMRVFDVITRIEPDGRVAVITTTERIEFADIQAAWGYCLEQFSIRS